MCSYEVGGFLNVCIIIDKMFSTDGNSRWKAKGSGEEHIQMTSRGPTERIWGEVAPTSTYVGQHSLRTAPLTGSLLLHATKTNQLT